MYHVYHAQREVNEIGAPHAERRDQQAGQELSWLLTWDWYSSQVHSLAHGCYGYAYGLVKTLDIYIKSASLIIIGGI